MGKTTWRLGEYKPPMCATSESEDADFPEFALDRYEGDKCVHRGAVLVFSSVEDAGVIVDALNEAYGK